MRHGKEPDTASPATVSTASPLVVFGPTLEHGDYYCRVYDPATGMDAVGVSADSELARVAAIRLLGEKLAKSQKKLDSEHTM